MPTNRTLTTDARLLFGTRCARLFAYGLLSVVLALYLSAVGISETEIGLLVTLALLGDTAISLGLTTTADRVGRRKMLVTGSLLMVFAGLVFALSSDFWLLLLAATVGVISPSGNEIGPFLSIEQAALSETVSSERRTGVFAWYNLLGSVATALGALCGGEIAQLLQNQGFTNVESYRALAIIYATIGALMAVAFTRISPASEVKPTDAPAPERRMPWSSLGLGQSRGVVLKLAGLFAMDAFGGGFIVQTILALWFHLQYGLSDAALGALFFGANLLAAASALAAAAVARRFGLVNTMVFTHLPSNILLILIPLMPTLGGAIVLLLLRFSISQMDVPTRQSYTMAVVSPEERSAAAGVTGVARSLGAAISPSLAMALIGHPALMSVPFFLAGGIKIVYDFLLYRSFVKVKGDQAANC